MTPPQDAPRHRKHQHGNLVLLLALLVFSITCIGLALFGKWGQANARFVPITMHSLLRARYQADPFTLQIRPLDLRVVQSVIEDNPEPTGMAPERVVTLEDILLTPVPTVTPQPTRQGNPPPATNTPPAAPNPTSTPQANQSPTPSATPQTNLTPINLTPTSTITASLTPTPSATPTQASALTQPPTSTRTPTSTLTPTPGNILTQPPTPTRTATQPAVTPVSPTPTRTTAPQPTNTPVPTSGYPPPPTPRPPTPTNPGYPQPPGLTNRPTDRPRSTKTPNHPWDATETATLAPYDAITIPQTGMDLPTRNPWSVLTGWLKDIWNAFVQWLHNISLL